jgi:hypothetical protein
MIVAEPAPLEAPHEAPLIQRLPYAQVSLALAGLMFVLALYFLATPDERAA